MDSIPAERAYLNETIPGLGLGAGYESRLKIDVIRRVENPQLAFWTPRRVKVLHKVVFRTMHNRGNKAISTLE